MPAQPRVMEIITPSYRADRDLCGDLVRSVRRFAPAGTRHTIIVPPEDVDMFLPLRDEGTIIVSTRDVMPRGFFRLPLVNMWLNAGAPWVPVRGWIAQQILKLQASALSTADAVLLADSDMEFIRPFSLADYLVDDRIPLYRLADAVGPDNLPGHIVWDEVSRRLLGLPPGESPRRADYICWPCVWDPAVVRGMLTRIERVTGRPWAAAVGRELRFSEMMLYGIYAEHGTPAADRMPFTTDMHCPPFSDERALDDAALGDFLRTVRATDAAVMISAKSGTDLRIRRRMISALREAGTSSTPGAQPRRDDAAGAATRQARTRIRGEA